MKLLKLQLENFRSHKSFKTEFEDENIILILGENGKGKTNILEGIFMLVAGKAFRDADNDDLIYWGMDFFTIKGVTDKGISLEVSYANYPRKQKIFKKNEVKISHNEYIGNFVCVLFHPKDLNMLYLEPSLRRKYMNLTLSQTDKFYLEALGEYTKILKHRNALLDTISEGEKPQNELSVWDEKLASSGSVIINKRLEFIEFINTKIEYHYRKISGGKESLEVKYSGEKTDSKTFVKKLLLRRDRDIRYASTSVGPHLDDMKFIINGREIGQVASRGEFRTILIALKLAEIDYIKNKIKENPILLLDDVFSELDDYRQEHLFKAIEGHQTFITATDIKKSPFLQGISRKLEIV